MIPCYVTGKGMNASESTWLFKTWVFELLTKNKLGFDTRHHYYQQIFPDLDKQKLARLVCDPMEDYDPDWPTYFAAKQSDVSKLEAATAFMLIRDNHFIEQAQVLIGCFDEAGLGSGINCMRFLSAGKSMFGIYRQNDQSTVNYSNVLQLQLLYPEQVTLMAYESLEEIEQPLTNWLRATIQASSKPALEK